MPFALSGRTGTGLRPAEVVRVRSGACRGKVALDLGVLL